MEHSKRNTLQSVVVKVILAFLIATPVGAQLKCSNYHYSDRCTIQNLWIAPEQVDSLKFPVQENIELTNVDADYLSPQVMERMKWVSKLTITNGRVARIYLKPDLQQLSATQSKTFEIVIEDAENEDLEVLTVVSNNLKAIPENIEKLKALTTLQLKENKIEVLDMNRFRTLEKLVAIDVSSNRLYYLAPVEALELNRLKTLDLGRNLLTEVDFANWIMPRLQTLTISANHLSYLMNLEVETFPSLQTFALLDNQFDCRWLAHHSDELWNITKRQLRYDHNRACSKTIRLSPATYRGLNISDIRSTGFQFENKAQLEEQINGMTETSQNQSKQIDSLSVSVAKQAKQLAEANARLLQQQVLIDDLLVRIESLYKQMENLQELSQDAPDGETASEGLSAKLIREISQVIRKNVPE